jgi:hypothetical protein
MVVVERVPPVVQVAAREAAEAHAHIVAKTHAKVHAKEVAEVAVPICLSFRDVLFRL